ncbi:uncharacterized protein si:ch211-215i13.3 isoform X3 [Girardinichthys multiradiatus]|uniref:uncharacterized protein si:ch211-215i13.3 isoform X3 n=1 Tax=Girardinichthys multiradiatus TaxID=208333 RepID=UPI001FAD5B22|nr:uncharacterized protein si:ch211-215i13.3 isoform X3 [Girardinichthys multiradiatus]
MTHNASVCVDNGQLLTACGEKHHPAAAAAAAAAEDDDDDDDGNTNRDRTEVKDAAAVAVRQTEPSPPPLFYPCQLHLPWMIFSMGCGGSRADAIIEPRYHESWTRETESTWLTNTDVEPPVSVPNTRYSRLQKESIEGGERLVQGWQARQQCWRSRAGECLQREVKEELQHCEEAN